MEQQCGHKPPKEKPLTQKVEETAGDLLFMAVALTGAILKTAFWPPSAVRLIRNNDPAGPLTVGPILYFVACNFLGLTLPNVVARLFGGSNPGERGVVAEIVGTVSTDAILLRVLPQLVVGLLLIAIFLGDRRRLLPGATEPGIQSYAFAAGYATLVGAEAVAAMLLLSGPIPANLVMVVIASRLRALSLRKGCRRRRFDRFDSSAMLPA